jgi:hypothetical protein
MRCSTDCFDCSLAGVLNLAVHLTDDGPHLPFLGMPCPIRTRVPTQTTLSSSDYCSLLRVGDCSCCFRWVRQTEQWQAPIDWLAL